MPYTLGITLDGNSITDKSAKIIGLLVMGLCYVQIQQVIYINPRCLCNEVSDVYGRLRCAKDHSTLIFIALTNGYNHYCCVNGKDILDADERKRLVALNPRILQLNKRLRVVFE